MSASSVHWKALCIAIALAGMASGVTGKDAVTCLDVEGYEVKANMDHPGEGMGPREHDLTLEDLAALCNKRPSCQGFTMIPVKPKSNDASSGQLKKVATPTKSARGVCLYARKSGGGAISITMPPDFSLPATDASGRAVQDVVDIVRGRVIAADKTGKLTVTCTTKPATGMVAIGASALASCKAVDAAGNMATSSKPTSVKIIASCFVNNGGCDEGVKCTQAARTLAITCVKNAGALDDCNADGIAYNSDEGTQGYKPNWMQCIDASVSLSRISMPGTHDSMSVHWGDAVETQAMSLSDQLYSGIRAFDIRCKHMNDMCQIHHGISDQEATLDDVLTAVTNFLTANPSETVLMRLKEPEDDAEDNTRTFEQTYLAYVAKYGQKFFWNGNFNAIPSLGEVRGKIVIMQDFDGGSHGLPYGGSLFDIQDNYDLDTNWDLYSKWESVKAQLQHAADSGNDKLFMNYLSGSGGSFPYFVASGQSSPGNDDSFLLTGLICCGGLCSDDEYPDFPRVACLDDDDEWCSIAFKGTDYLTHEWNGWNSSPRRVGIIMADFPGCGLISRIIDQNKGLGTC